MTRLTSGFASLVGTLIVGAALVAILVLRAGGPQSAGSTATSSQAQVHTQLSDGSISLAPETAPEPQEPGCQRHLTMVDEAPISIELATAISSSVVIASVSEEGPGRWRTNDELAPKARAAGTDVMRLLRLAVQDDLGAKSVAQDAIVWVPGGAIGCDLYMVGGFQSQFDKAKTFAFFLDGKQDPTSQLREIPRVLWIWPIEDSSILTATEGTLSVGDFKATVQELSRGR